MWSFLRLLQAIEKRGGDLYPCFWRPISITHLMEWLVQDNHYHQKFHYYSMNCRIKFFTLERFSIERFSVFEDVTSNSNLYIQGNMTPPCLVNSPPKNPYSNLHILHISSCHDFNLKLSKHSEQTCNLSRKLRFWFV